MSSIVLEMGGVSIVLGGAAGVISGLTVPMAFLRSFEISFMSSDRILNMSMSSSILFSRSLIFSLSSLIGSFLRRVILLCYSLFCLTLCGVYSCLVN